MGGLYQDLFNRLSSLLDSSHLLDYLAVDLLVGSLTPQEVKVAETSEVSDASDGALRENGDGLLEGGCYCFDDHVIVLT